jgi:CBS domain-containing protein
MVLTSEWMTPDPVVVASDEPIARCARKIEAHGVRHLAVIDREGRLAGMVMDAAVWRRGAMIGVRERTFVAYDERDDVLTAQDLATGVDVVVGPDTPLTAALARLLSTPQDAALVVDDERLVGILTEHDVVRYAAETLPDGLTVGHLGPKEVVAVSRHTPASAAWDRMTEAHVRHLVVTDGPVIDGVLSIRDLLADEADRRESSLVAADLVRRRPPVVVSPTTPLREAAARMAAEHVGLLPVLDAGRVVAVCSRTDIARAALAAIRDEDLFGGA